VPRPHNCRIRSITPQIRGRPPNRKTIRNPQSQAQGLAQINSLIYACGHPHHRGKRASGAEVSPNHHLTRIHRLSDPSRNPSRVYCPRTRTVKKSERNALRRSGAGMLLAQGSDNPSSAEANGSNLSNAGQFEHSKRRVQGPA